MKDGEVQVTNLAIEIINVVTDLHDLDALDKALPEVLDRLERHLHQSGDRTMSVELEERQILINLIAGMVLADHMGDAAEDCIEAAKQIGIEVPGHFLSSGGDACGTDTPLERLSEYLVTYHNAKTVWGTELFDDGDDQALQVPHD